MTVREAARLASRPWFVQLHDGAPGGDGNTSNAADLGGSQLDCSTLGWKR